MKAAKEWAADVVDERDGAMVLHHLGGGRYVAVDVAVDASELDEVIGDARIVIERLVERVQADARAPLEAAIARRDAHAAGLQREVNEWRKVACDRGRALGNVANALEEICGAAAPNSAAEHICDRLLPLIEEAMT